MNYQTFLLDHHAVLLVLPVKADVVPVVRNASGLAS